jgi:hypothetical protein
MPGLPGRSGSLRRRGGRAGSRPRGAAVSSNAANVGVPFRERAAAAVPPTRCLRQPEAITPGPWLLSPNTGSAAARGRADARARERASGRGPVDAPFRRDALARWPGRRRTRTSPKASSDVLAESEESNHAVEYAPVAWRPDERLHAQALAGDREAKC